MRASNTICRIPSTFVVGFALLLSACSQSSGAPSTAINTSTELIPTTQFTPTAPPSPVVNVVPSSGDPEKRVISVIDVPQNNCLGTAEVTNEVERARTITHSAEYGGSVSVNASGKAGVPVIGEVEIGTEIAAHYGQTYGEAETVRRSLTVRTIAGTNIDHKIQEVEVWQIGDAVISVAGKEVSRIPFKFRTDFGVELVGDKSLPCPTQIPIATIESSPTVAASPSSFPVATTTLLSTAVSSPVVTGTDAISATTEPSSNPTAVSASAPSQTPVTAAQPEIAHCPKTLDFGQLAECSLTSGQETAEYTFQAEINDLIMVRVNKLSGNLEPNVVVLDPNDNDVCKDAQHVLVNLACSVTSSGTYRIRVSDYSSKNTGQFKVYTQRFNNPGHAIPIEYGKSFSNGIPAVAEVNTLIIAASIDDQLLIRLNKTAGTFAPRLSVYDPSGVAICDDAKDVTIAIPCPIKQDGNYTIIIDDYNIRATGKYNLLVQRLNNPGNPIPLTFGKALQGSLPLISFFNTYTFAGHTNDTVDLSVVRTKGSIAPHVLVYDPAGMLVCQQSDQTNARIQNCALTQDGQFTVIAQDYYLKNVGDYTITMECSAGACKN